LGVVDDAIRLAREARARVLLYQPVHASLPTATTLVARLVDARSGGVNIHTAMAPGAAGPEVEAYWLRDSGASVGSRTAATGTRVDSESRNVQSRAGNTFLFVLARYVQEEGVLSLGQAIQRMTSVAAGQFRLDRRGAIRVDHHADLVVFDPASLNAGMRHVMVNGVVVIDQTSPTGARPGRAVLGRPHIVAKAGS
jgi:hypothetical protein